MIPDVGHFLMLENPEAFNSVLTNVIKSLPD
jgi:pimeloyl-ACP methyl ester carboxylesterase